MEQYRKALAELHSGEPRIITKGKLPDSHIVFLDEIFKASDGILNALLTALNERRYTNEGKTIHIPTISFFSASNEIPISQIRRRRSSSRSMTGLSSRWSLSMWKTGTPA